MALEPVSPQVEDIAEEGQHILVEARRIGRARRLPAMVQTMSRSTLLPQLRAFWLALDWIDRRKTHQLGLSFPSAFRAGARGAPS